MNPVFYVSIAGAGSIAVFSLDAESGALSRLQEVTPGGEIMPLAASPDGRFLYAARRSDPLSLLAFTIGDEGQLAEHAEAPLQASIPYITTDASGKWLLAASYHSGLLSVSRLAEGRPEPASQVVYCGDKMHSVAVMPGNREVFAASLGTDEVMRFAFDDVGGRLTHLGAIRVRPGSGPRHLAVNPATREAWVVGELDGTVTSLASGNAIDCLPPESAGRAWSADLKLGRTGKHLYVSDRNSHTIALIGLAEATGSMQLVGHWPAPREPRSFALSEDGRWLVCAGQAGDMLRCYRVDTASGALEAASEIVCGPKPSWVEFRRAPTRG